MKKHQQPISLCLDEIDLVVHQKAVEEQMR